jgi:hypothetical protein
MNRPILNITIVKPSDARGWIGLGCFVLVLVILAMIAFDKRLLDNNAFLVLASAIVLTGWNQGPVGWAYQATKSGGELADKQADIIKERAATDAAAIAATPTGTPGDPISTKDV